MVTYETLAITHARSSSEHVNPVRLEYKDIFKSIFALMLF